MIINPCDICINKTQCIKENWNLCKFKEREEPMQEYDVIIYEIKAIAKTKVKANNWNEVKDKLPKLVKEVTFIPHKEYKVTVDL